MLRVLSISADGFYLTFLCPKTAERSLAYGDFIQGRNQPFFVFVFVFFPFRPDLLKSCWSKEVTGLAGDFEDIIGSQVNAHL